MQRAHDADLYKERKRIERFFNKLKQFQRAATRYDKLLVNVMGLAKLAAITVAIRVKQLSPVRLLRPGQLIVCGRTVDMLLYNAARKTRDPAGRPAYEMNMVHASCTPDRSKPGQPTEQAGFHRGDFPGYRSKRHRSEVSHQRPNLVAHSDTVWNETSAPRSASRLST
ncbi:transposase [Rhizobium leguminosarum]|nr:transposase [Rhizobium leguminosarum]